MSGNELYEIKYLSVVVDEDLPRLSAPVKSRIIKEIERKLTKDPLGYSLKGNHSLRVGDYRVIYYITSESNHIIIITAIRHRKDVY